MKEIQLLQLSIRVANSGWDSFIQLYFSNSHFRGQQSTDVTTSKNQLILISQTASLTSIKDGSNLSYLQSRQVNRKELLLLMVFPLAKSTLDYLVLQNFIQKAVLKPGCIICLKHENQSTKLLVFQLEPQRHLCESSK